MTIFLNALFKNALLNHVKLNVLVSFKYILNHVLMRCCHALNKYLYFDI